MAGEGEWKITIDVFRDLGLAFAAAIVMIYVLLLGQTGSLGIPLIMMIAIPLTVIGIIPGFWFINLFTEPLGDYANLFYCDSHDWHDRSGGNRGSKFDYSDRFYRACLQS